jgi:hypothetical protein
VEAAAVPETPVDMYRIFVLSNRVFNNVNSPNTLSCTTTNKWAQGNFSDKIGCPTTGSKISHTTLLGIRKTKLAALVLYVDHSKREVVEPKNPSLLHLYQACGGFNGAVVIRIIKGKEKVPCSISRVSRSRLGLSWGYGTFDWEYD